MVQDAAEKDCQVATEAKPKGGVYDVLLPISLPDEGTFDWLDLFLEKHPEYVELSDRMILDWAEKSGIWTPKGYAWKACNDKPGVHFGVPSLDDNSIKNMLYSIAPLQQRHYVVMEVRGNLLKEERLATLKKLAAPHLKFSAMVLLGEPAKDVKDRMQILMLQDKQEKSDMEWKVKQQQEINKARVEKAKKQSERLQSKAKKARTEANAPAAEANGNGEANGEEKKPEEEKMEVDAEKEDEPDAEEAALDAKIAELAAAAPPKAQLTDEEKKVFFRKPKISDLTPMVLSMAFANFTVPEKEEGFADVKYEWTKKAQCASFLKEWIQNMKLTSRVEELQPGEWFTKQWVSWQQELQSWHAKKTEYDTKKRAKVMKTWTPLARVG